MKSVIKILVLAALLFFVFYNPASLWKNIAYERPEGNTLQSHLASNTIFIGKLSISAPIIYVEENSEKSFQKALQNGVVHYPGTANPGEFGNVYIFGHSSDFIWKSGNYKTVFALLPKIEVGDQIEVSDEHGLGYVYKVIETKVVKPDDLSVLDQQDYKRKLLTLQTSYPLGTALRRYIVIAEMK